jgi:hypothetical protein
MMMSVSLFHQLPYFGQQNIARKMLKFSPRLHMLDMTGPLEEEANKN